MFILLRSFNIFLTLILRFPSGFSSLSEKNTFFFLSQAFRFKKNPDPSQDPDLFNSGCGQPATLPASWGSRHRRYPPQS